MLRRLLLLTLTLGILCVSFPSFAQTCTGLCLQQTSCPGSGHHITQRNGLCAKWHGSVAECACLRPEWDGRSV